MILTTKARYAVMATIEISENAEKEPVSLLTISKSQGISLSYLEQIFARLKKFGIVKSVRGPGGGYVLNGNQQEITVSKIIKAVGEPIKMTRCKGGSKNCLNQKKERCKAHNIWQGLEDKIYEYLDSVSLCEVLGENSLSKKMSKKCQQVR